jgi:hypothetical protein
MITPAEITRGQVREIAARYGVTPDTLLSKHHPRSLLQARIELAQALRKRGYSCPRIGAVMNRDPSTVSFYLDLCAKKPSPWSLAQTRQSPPPPPEPPPEPRRPIPYAGYQRSQHDHR